MAPRVLVVDPERPDPASMAEAARALADGKLVAFPTETVYGLGARALDEASITRIFEAKGRPKSHPLIAHVPGEEAARELTRFWPDAATALVRAFWPGPLTLVLPRAAHVPASLTGGGPTIAVRAPRHPVAMALVSALGEAVAAPSANRYQTLSPTRAEHVVQSLGERVDLVLDGGPCAEGIESTVLDLTTPEPTVLRPGALRIDELRAVVPDIVLARLSVPPSSRRASPGMDPRHYAPRAELRVIRGREQAQAMADEETRSGRNVGLLLRGEGVGVLVLAPACRSVRVLPADPSGYARELFAALHDFDDEGVDLIVAEAVPDDEAWYALADRLARASFR